MSASRKRKIGSLSKRDTASNDAASSLLQLGGTSNAVACPLCGEQFYVGPAKYSICLPVRLSDAEAKRLVRNGRRHCQDKHSTRFLWNLVPRMDKLVNNTERDMESEVDVMFSIAMTRAAKLHPVQTYTPDKFIWMTLICRLTAAKCWLSWMVVRRAELHKKHGKAMASRIIKLTITELDKLLLRMWNCPAVQYVGKSVRKEVIGADMEPNCDRKCEVDCNELVNELNLIAHMPGHRKSSWLIDALQKGATFS